MDIGRLNKRITIQTQSTAYDEVGQLIDDWSTFATVWANIAHKSGIESIKAEAVASMVKASFRIRYLAGVNAGMRIIFLGSQYQILAVLAHVDDNRYVDLVAELTNGVVP
jgi:SPP1 family predicted phage head-tail adaptor